MKKHSFFIIISFILYNAFINPLHSQCYVKIEPAFTSYCPGDQLNLTATGHCGTILFYDDFDSLVANPNWDITAANPVFTNPCGPGPSGAYAWVGTTSSSVRALGTNALNITSNNCTVEFDMRYGRVQGSGDCEDPDASNEGVHLQYSTNGSMWYDFPPPHIDPVGPNTTAPPFITIVNGSGGYWEPENNEPAQLASGLYYWHRYSCPVPTAAITSNTKIRWAQLNTSSAGFDAWGIDEVIINCDDTATIWVWIDPLDSVVSNTRFLSSSNPIQGWYKCVATNTVSLSQAMDSIYITVHPYPVVDIGPDTFILKSESLLLDAGSGFHSYKWSTTPGGQAISYNQTLVVDSTNAFLGQNYFHVIATDYNQCIGSDFIYVTLTLTGIEEDSRNDNSTLIYPNPATDCFTIDLLSNPTDRHLVLYNAEGKVLFEEVIPAGVDWSKDYSTSEYSNGLYVIEINNGSQRSFFKLIIRN